MKKILSILLFLIISLQLTICNVHAASCKPDALEEKVYSQGDYGNVGYCDLSVNNMSDSGCMPTAYAIVVANLVDSSVTPETIRNNICENENLKVAVRGSSGNGPGVAAYMFNNGTYALEHAQKYNLIITKTDERDIEQIKNILRQKDSMLIVSLKCPGGNSFDNPGCFFSTSSSGHYVVLSNVDSNGKIVVLNPGRKDTAKGSYDDSVIQENILNVVNQGIWKITANPDNCSKVTSNPTQDGSSNNGGTACDPNTTGRTEDCYDDWGNIFGNIDPEENNGCSTIFIDKDGNYTELHEFVQGLFTLIKIATPIIVIALSTFDYIKAIASSNADEMKKTNSRTIKRLIVGLIIFFLPFILDILFELFGLYDLSRCNIGT